MPMLNYNLEWCSQGRSMLIEHSNVLDTSISSGMQSCVDSIKDAKRTCIQEILDYVLKVC